MCFLGIAIDEKFSNGLIMQHLYSTKFKSLFYDAFFAPTSGDDPILYFYYKRVPLSGVPWVTSH